MDREDRECGQAVELFLETIEFELYDMMSLPTAHAYLGAFGMAKSVRQLERLHQSLPENAQLLSHDFNRLKMLWRYCLSGKSESCRELVLQRVLQEILRDHESGNAQRAFSHYLRAIRDYGEKKPPKHFSKGEDGHGGFNYHSIHNLHKRCVFECKLFGTVVDVEFFLTYDRKHILIRLIFREIDLTEKITHQITSTLRPYYIYRYGVSISCTGIGRYIYISSEFETGDLMNYLTEEKKMYGFARTEITATSDFLQMATKFMQTHNIPVDGCLVSQEKAR